MVQRPAVLLANGDEDLMNFKERSALIVFDSLVGGSLKLLLTGMNPKIDEEKEGEFNPRCFLKGQIWGDF